MLACRRGAICFSFCRLQCRLRSQAPYFSMITAGLTQRLASLQIPFCNRCCVTNAEQPRLAKNNPPVGVYFIRILCPYKSIDTAIFSATDYGLLEPRTIQRVPDLDITICPPYSQPWLHRLLILGDMRMGKCERIDCRGGVGHESAAVDIHGADLCPAKCRFAFPYVRKYIQKSSRNNFGWR